MKWIADGASREPPGGRKTCRNIQRRREELKVKVRTKTHRSMVHVSHKYAVCALVKVLFFTYCFMLVSSAVQ